MSSFENASTFGDVLTISNSLSGGIFVYSIIFTFATVLFLGAIGFGRGKAMVFSSFLTSLLCVILNNMGLVEYWVIIPFLVIFAFGLFMMQQKKGEYGG